MVGTRPNFLKETAFRRALEGTGIQEILVHTGQHYDYELSQLFFDELELPKPNYYGEVAETNSTGQLAQLLPFLQEILMNEKPTATIVYGDVTSTTAAAFVSARMGIPVAHIEAGIRTEDRFNPEEINRRVADHLSDLLLPNIREAHDNLIREGFPPSDVILTGDIVMDVILFTVESLGIQPSRGDYSLVTIHREENAASPDRLRAIMEGLMASGQALVFPAHPRTRKALEAIGLARRLAQSNVELLNPLGYKEFVTLLAGADKVISDSGGVRREAYILGKPVISLIEFVWVPSMVEAGWELVVGPKSDSIASAIRSFDPRADRPAIFGDGQAAGRIVQSLVARYG